MPPLSNALIEQAAQFDPDRTLAASFADAPARQHLIGLLHFAHEIGRVREVVSEPHLGAIRLQWWRDALDEIYAGKPVRRHEVAQALAETIHATNLPAHLFHAMIDARSADFETIPFATWTDLETYCDATAGNLMRLSALACGAPSLSLALDDAARQAGCAWAYAGLMRALPLWSARRSTFLPKDALDTNKVDPEALFAGRPTPELAAVRQEMGSRIVRFARLANANLGQVSPEAFPALAYATLARPWAKASVKLRDPFRETAHVLLLERQVRLVCAVALRRV
jgi:phytoene/squalene synthetase